MIFITGDTHIPLDIEKLNDNFYEKQMMTKKDYLIICGDFGGVWDGSPERTRILSSLNRQRFTTLFIDGNHENFHLLNQYPVMQWNGGLAHRIKSSIYHLMRGQVFTLQGKTFFTMGGGNSADKMYRVPGISWWAEEMPSEKEYQTARLNLKRVGQKVDYIVTHTAPLSVVRYFYEPDDERKLNEFLEEVKQTTDYKKWFFGHVHKDEEVDERHVALYHKILEVK